MSRREERKANFQPDLVYTDLNHEIATICREHETQAWSNRIIPRKKVNPLGKVSYSHESE